MSPAVNFDVNTTLIAQAKSDFNALISVQNVLDLETDFTCEMKAPAELFNTLFYFRSESLLDGQGATRELLPDLDVAMDPRAFSDFLHYKWAPSEGEAERTHKPSFVTLPFSQADMLTQQFNAPTDSTNPGITEDETVAKHYAYWIMSLLFGPNGIGFTANHTQLVGSVINLNDDFNDSMKRTINKNGGHVPFLDKNRDLASGLGSGRYKTPTEDGIAPREVNLASGAPTSVESKQSNNICGQVLREFYSEDKVEADRRIQASIDAVDYPKRRNAAIAAAGNEVDNAGDDTDLATAMTELKKLLEVLDLRGFENSTIFTRLQEDSQAAADGNSQSLQSYYGKYILTHDEWDLYTANGGNDPYPTDDGFKIVPEAIYNAYVSAVDRARNSSDNVDFVPLLEWQPGDSFSMLLALASVNKAVVRTTTLNGTSQQQEFVPVHPSRQLLQSNNAFFQRQNPQTEYNSYQHLTKSNAGDPDVPGSIYDGDLNVPSGDLLGWRLGSIKLILTDKLNREECRVLAAWAHVIGVFMYWKYKEYAVKDLATETDEAEKQKIRLAKAYLDRELWGGASVISEEQLAEQTISILETAKYQEMFNKIDDEGRLRDENLAGEDPQHSVELWTDEFFGGTDDVPTRIYSVITTFMNADGIPLSVDALPSGSDWWTPNNVPNEVVDKVEAAIQLYNTLVPAVP